MDGKIFSGDDSAKILVRDNNELGYSYYVEDDDDYYYYDDSDDWYYYDDYDNDGWYQDSYVSGNYGKSGTYYNDYYGNYGNYYGNYYSYPYSSRRYGSLYDYDDYWYDDYYYDDYYDDDYYDDYYRREERERSLILDGSTLKVGSKYDKDIWLNNASGAFATVRVIDDSDNDNDLFITGNSRSNSIISGKGVTTLWGAGGGSNTLVGASRRNYFWYEGNSRDVATKFATGETNYSDVVVLSNVNYSSINRDAYSITFNMSDGNYMQLQPDGASYDDDPIFFSGNGADIYRYKIAQNTSTSLNYRDDVNMYYFSQPGQIMVSGSGHNIWLGGDSGQRFTNVSTINAGASSGYNTLMGNDQPNVIIGGSGVSTLWGGVGVATDTLIGGQGPEIFRAGRFEGSDVIYTNEGHDVIFLYDTNLSDITSAEVVGDVVAIGFNSGTFLNVHNTAEVTSIFQLSNGARYNYNRSTQQWQGA